MQKKQYEKPEFVELGSFVNLTRCSWEGENFDGVLPDESPEIFGS